MTKEEEKTIYRLNKDKNNPLACGDITIVNVEDIETVLNMLKEKDEKIEYYKKQKNYDDQFKHELLEEIRCLNLDKDEKDREIEKKDKIIDLMAEYIDSNNYVDNEECQFQWDFNIKKCIENGDCKDCIKQYFERKSK